MENPVDPRNPENGKTAKSNEPDGGASVGAQFIWEVVIFLSGLFIGFLWYMYNELSPSKAETHLIIGLMVIIICMARYLYMLWVRQK